MFSYLKSKFFPDENFDDDEEEDLTSELNIEEEPGLKDLEEVN